MHGGDRLSTGALGPRSCRWRPWMADGQHRAAVAASESLAIVACDRHGGTAVPVATDRMPAAVSQMSRLSKPALSCRATVSSGEKTLKGHADPADVGERSRHLSDAGWSDHRHGARRTADGALMESGTLNGGRWLRYGRTRPASQRRWAAGCRELLEALPARACGDHWAYAAQRFAGTVRLARIWRQRCGVLINTPPVASWTGDAKGRSDRPAFAIRARSSSRLHSSRSRSTAVELLAAIALGQCAEATDRRQCRPRRRRSRPRLPSGRPAVERRQRIDRAAIADAGDMAGALILEDLLDALDGETLVVEQMADAFEQQHVFGAVVAPAAAALQRPDGGKPRLPEAQHVLRQVELFSGLRDGTEGVGRLVQPESLRRKSYFPTLTIDLLILDFNTLLGLNTRT